MGSACVANTIGIVLRGLASGPDLRRGGGEDNVYIQRDQLVGELPKLVGGFGKAELDSDVLALEIAKALQAGPQCFNTSCCCSGSPEAQVADARNFRCLLSAGGDRSCEGAPDEPDELAPL